jgi:hypothetical protein
MATFEEMAKRTTFGKRNTSGLSLEDMLPSQSRPKLSTPIETENSIDTKVADANPTAPASSQWDNIMANIGDDDIGVMEFGWEALKRTPKVFMSMAETAARAIRRGDEDINVDSSLDKFIDYAKGWNQDYQQLGQGERKRKLAHVPFVDVDITLGDLDDMMTSAGYSLSGMIVQKITGALGKRAGAGLTAWGSPALQAGGAMAGGKVGEVAGGMAYLTAAAYDQFIDQHKEFYFNENVGKISPEDMQKAWAKTYETIKEDARLYAFWEAAPEVASNMMMWGIAKAGRGGLSKKAMQGMMDKLMKGVAGKAALKFGIPVAKLSLMMAEEQGTEMITQKMHSKLEAKYGHRDKEATWKEALQEVFPQTFLQTLGMGGGAMILSKFGQRPDKKKPGPKDKQRSAEQERLDKIHETLGDKTGVKTKEELDEEATNLTEHEKRKLEEKTKAVEAASGLDADGRQIVTSKKEVDALKKWGKWNEKEFVYKPKAKKGKDAKAAAAEEAKAKATVNRMTAQDMQDKINKEWNNDNEGLRLSDMLPVPTRQSIVPPKGIQPTEFNQPQLPAPRTQYTNIVELENDAYSFMGKKQGRGGYKAESTAQKKADTINNDPLSPVNAYVAQVTKGKEAGWYIIHSPRQRIQSTPPKIVPDAPGQVIYLSPDIVEQTGDRKREELAEAGQKVELLEDSEVDAAYALFKAEQGEFSRLSEELTDAEKFEILAEDVVLPEVENEVGNAEMISKIKQEDAIAVPARMTYDGTVMPDPGTKNPNHQWEPKPFSKLKTKDIRNLHRAWNRAASHVAKILPHSDGINGFIINGEFFTDRFVLQSKKFFTKAAQKIRDKEAKASEVQQQISLVKEAQERAKQKKIDEQGFNEDVVKAYEEKVTDKVIWSAIRTFRRKSPFASLFPAGWKDRETGRVIPDSLLTVAQEAGWDVVADAVRNGKAHPEKQTVLKKKNALIGALINKLNDHARKEVQQQTGMTEHEARKAMAEGSLKLPKTGQVARTDEEMDIVENMADLEEGVQLGEVPLETGIDVGHERLMRSLRAALTQRKAKDGRIAKYLKDKYGDSKLRGDIPDAVLLDMGERFLPRRQFERILTRVPVEKRPGKVTYISNYQRKKQIRIADRNAKMLAELNPPKAPGTAKRGPMSSYVDPYTLAVYDGRTHEGLKDMSHALDGEYFQMRVKKKGFIPAFFNTQKEALDAAVALNEEFTKAGDPTVSYRPVGWAGKWTIEKTVFETPSEWDKKQVALAVKQGRIKESELLKDHVGVLPVAPVWHATMPGKEYEMRVNQYYALLNTLAKSKVGAYEAGRPWNMQRVLENSKTTWLMDPDYYAFSWQVDRTEPTASRKPTLTRDKVVDGKKTREHKINYWQRFLKLKLPKKGYILTNEAVLAAHNISPRGNTSIEAILSPEIEKRMLKNHGTRLVKKVYGAGGYMWQSPDGVIKLYPARFMRIHRKFGDMRKTGFESNQFIFEDLDSITKRYEDKGQADMVKDIKKARFGEAIDPATDVEYLEQAAGGPRAEIGGPSGKIVRPRVPALKRTKGDERTGFKEDIQYGASGVILLDMKEIRTVGLKEYSDTLVANMQSAGMTDTEMEKLNKFIESQNKFWAEVRHAEQQLEMGKAFHELSGRQQTQIKEAEALKKRDRKNKQFKQAQLAKDRIKPKYVDPTPPPVDEVTEAVLKTRAEAMYKAGKRRKVQPELSPQAKAALETAQEKAGTQKPKTGKPTVDLADWDDGDYVIKFKDGAAVAGIDAGNAWENAPSKYKTKIAKHEGTLWRIVGEGDARKLVQVHTPRESGPSKTEAQEIVSGNQLHPSDPVVAETKPEPVKESTPTQREAQRLVSEDRATPETVAEARVEKVEKDAKKDAPTDPGNDWAKYNGQWIKIPEVDEDFDQMFYNDLIMQNADRFATNPGLEDKLFALEERASELEDADLEEAYSDEAVYKNFSSPTTHNPFTGEEGKVAGGLNPMNWPYHGVKGVRTIAKAFTPTAGRFQKSMQKLVDALDVEVAFQRMKQGGKSGFHVKNIFSYREAHFDKFEKNVIQHFQRLVQKHLPGAKPEHLADIVFAAENATVQTAKGNRKYEDVLREVAGDELYLKGYAPLIRFMRKFFDATRQEYSDRGVDVDWIQRKHDELMQKWEAHDHTMEKDELEAMKKAMYLLGQLQGMHFIHIPSSMWLVERIHEIVPGKVGTPQFEKKLKKLMDNIRTERQAMSIASLVSKGLIKKEAVNPFEVLMHYGYRQAEDFAYYNVRDAFVKDGLISHRKTKPRTPEGVSWELLPKHLQALTGNKKDLRSPKDNTHLRTWIRSDALAALNSATANIEPKGLVGRGMSMYKMLRFYNPLFLPAYDVIQSVAIAGANPFRFGLWKNAINSMKHKDKDYFDAASEGLFSKPFMAPFNDILVKARMLANGRTTQARWSGAQAYYDQTVLDIKDAFANGKYFKGLARTGTAPILAVMHGSWSVAWYLDNLVRMYTYHYLKTKGHKPHEAAQFAALAHGDYAGVPARTRRKLNTMFFTPTFKIAMAKAHMNLLKGAYDTTAMALKGDIKNNASKAKLAKRATKGLLMLVMVNQGFHLAMQALGYEDEEWGRRYVKRVMTENGLQEVVFNWSNPVNLFTKYYHRLMRLVNPPPYESHPGRKFLEEFLYEFHPAYQTAYRYLMNKRFDGDKIWHEWDDPWKQRMDKVKWIFAEELFPMIGAVNDKINKKTANQSIVQANKQLDKDMGVMLRLMTSPFVFKYTRSSPERRFQYQMTEMNRRFVSDRNQEFKKYRRVRPEWIKNYYKKYIKAIRDYYKEQSE